MKRAIEIILLCLCLCSCGIRYSAEEVNATVSVKIKEMASFQKVYITQETIVVKEYVVVTATPDLLWATQAVLDAQITPTATPFNWYTADMAAGMMRQNEIEVRRILIELSSEETNGISKFARSTTNLTISKLGNHADGRIFEFETPEALEQAKKKLEEKSSNSAYPKNVLIIFNNLIIELDGMIDSSLLEEVRTTFDPSVETSAK